ncbi:MAG: hypothetical protein AAB721_02805 [Patescibacteria group bacterium]
MLRPVSEGPLPSPKVPAPADEEPGTDPNLPVTKREMRRSFRVNEVYTVIVAIATAAAALLGGYRLFVSEARAAGEDAAKSAEKKANEVAAEQLEVRQDVRALYRAVLTGRPQERLEQPLPVPDGGPR